MSICLIEFSANNHYSQIQSWIDLNQYNKVKTYIFTNKKIYKFLRGNENCIFFFSEDSHNLLSFTFKAAFTVYKNKVQTINILSIQSIINFLLFIPLLFVSENRLYISIHDCGKWFNPHFIGNNYFKFILEYVFINIYKYFSTGYFTNSQVLKEYLVNTIKINKPVYVLPFALYNNKINQPVTPSRESLTITVPGALDPNRRLYSNILKLAEKIKSINIILLGQKINTNEKSLSIYNKACDLPNVKTFENFIEENEFDEFLGQTDLLFNDIVPIYSGDGYIEKYGQTKDSGVTYLMIRKALPGIINSEYNHDIILKNSTLYFENYNHLEQLIQNLIKHPQLIEDLKINAYHNSLSFTPSSVTASYLKNFYSNITKT